MNVEPEIFLDSIFLKLRFGFQYENCAFGGLTNCTSQIFCRTHFFHQKENIEREREWEFLVEWTSWTAA